MNLEQEFKEYTEWADKTFPNFQEVAPDDAMFQSWLEGKRRALNQSPWIAFDFDDTSTHPEFTRDLGDGRAISEPMVVLTGENELKVTHFVRFSENETGLWADCAFQKITHYMPVPATPKLP